MPDPIRLLSEWPGMRGMRRLPVATTVQIVREDPVQQAMQIIARHELRVWFEPRWADARRLAARFPRCLICSIPTESDTINLHRVPGWRPRPDRGVV
ncbi:MAG: hypothetical protein JWL77_2553 [Chthonomonadaceae bacterium]|nr:hypothetical protein [Chthonomonadaceae bacterium]